MSVASVFTARTLPVQCGVNYRCINYCHSYQLLIFEHILVYKSVGCWAGTGSESCPWPLSAGRRASLLLLCTCLFCTRHRQQAADAGVCAAAEYCRALLRRHQLPLAAAASMCCRRWKAAATVCCQVSPRHQ